MKALITWVAIAFFFGPLARAQQESESPPNQTDKYPEVPKEYEVGEDTISPDGRFAILYPIRDQDSMEEPTVPNVLVRLKPYKVLKDLGEIAWQGMRGEPKATWGGNQFVAIWKAMKWGNEDVLVYEIADDQVTREEKRIWPEVVKYFDRDFKNRFLKKYPSQSDSYTFVTDNTDVKSFEFKGHKLLLNIFAENKPNLAPGPIWSAEFHAIWNLDTGKFEKVDFKPGEISVRKPEDI